MSLSILEQNLLNKELEHITSVINKAHNEIYECLASYGLPKSARVNITGTDLTDYNEFIEKVVLDTFTSKYHAGDFLQPRKVYPANIPESLKKLILEKVTKDFIAKIEELREIYPE